MGFWNKLYKRQKTSFSKIQQVREVLGGIKARLNENNFSLIKKLVKGKVSAVLVLTALFSIFSQDAAGQVYTPDLERIKNAHIELAINMERGTLTPAQEYHKYETLVRYLTTMEDRIIKDINELIDGNKFEEARKNIELLKEMINNLNPDDAVLLYYVKTLENSLEEAKQKSEEDIKTYNNINEVGIVSGVSTIKLNSTGKTYIVTSAQIRANAEQRLNAHAAQYNIRLSSDVKSIVVNGNNGRQFHIIAFEILTQ